VSRWKVGAHRTLYRDQWVHVSSYDVELPDGRHLDHRVIDGAYGAGAVIIQDRAVLLLWRHRFITNTYGWEIPIGAIDDGEDPAVAAARETEEETGWRPGPLRPLIYTQPSPGLMTSQHHIFRADSATHIGPPADPYESERIAWVPLNEIVALIDKRDIVSGTTLSALLYVLATR
jgi:8-oxo-dGTP pyrophosphatase MutT (NUDIX family)